MINSQFFNVLVLLFIIFSIVSSKKAKQKKAGLDSEDPDEVINRKTFRNVQQLKNYKKSFKKQWMNKQEKVVNQDSNYNHIVLMI